MSKHIFRTQLESQPIEIQMGWDKPMQWYYLVISPICNDGRLCDPIYSNLDEEHPEKLPLRYFWELLQKFGIIPLPPDKMFDAILQDGLSNTANQRTEYSLIVD